MDTNTKTVIDYSKMTPEQLVAELKRRDEKGTRKGTPVGEGLSVQIGEKGGISLYGLQRMPVTLYFNQWQKLAASIGAIVEFGNAHRDQLKLEKPAVVSKPA